MAEEPLPDHLRCKRNDGRQWRCSRRVLDNLKLCELHHIQGRHRQYKQKVPDNLKLKKTKLLHKDFSQPRNLQIRARKIGKAKPPSAARLVAVSEALDEALKKMKLRKGDLRLELIRMVLVRQVEKRKKRSELEDFSEADLTRNLPNGFMEISPAHFNNAPSSCDVKIGADSDSVARRCFRSKNIEPLPIATLQVVPNGDGLRRGRRNKCHWCQRCMKDLVKCQRCEKESFCKDCIKERYYDTWEEVKMACPVCSGTCRCKACTAIQSRDTE